MSGSDQPSRTTCRRRRGFIKNREGSTAVEFGMIAVPFFALLFGVFETAIVYFKTQIMETAVMEAGRRIMTGQIAGEPDKEAAFRSALCNEVAWLIPCSDIHYDVKAYNTFAGADTSTPMSGGNLDTSALGFTPGAGGQIMVVRAYVPVDVMASYFGNTMANQANGKRLIVATAAFKNEPF